MERPRPTFSKSINHDCQRLLHCFVETESVRYDQFLHAWKRMNFGLLQCGLRDKVDQQLFLEDTFQVAVTYFLPPYGFQVRVGALYLLYAFYFTQPHLPRIRITLQQWQSTLAFLEEVRKQQHYDVEYVFRKLRMDKAFLFVALPTKMIPHKGDKTGEDEKDSTLDQPSILSEVFEGEPLEQVDNLHNLYHGMKCQISGSDVPNRSLDMVPESLAHIMSSIIAKHEEWRKKKREARYPKTKPVAKGSDDSDSDPEWQPEEDSSSRRRKIAEIKKNAYSNVAKVARSRRHRQQEDAAPKTSPVKGKKSPGKGKKRQRRQKTSKSTYKEDLSQNEADSQEISTAEEQEEKKSGSMPILVIDERKPTKHSPRKKSPVRRLRKRKDTDGESERQVQVHHKKAKMQASPGRRTKKRKDVSQSQDGDDRPKAQTRKKGRRSGKKVGKPTSRERKRK
ncbi:snRNA-activating protein complex subunit 1-like isoform X2 [Ptychodera flava]|uniref:snRNA-activating protein complex subunit 1-like isoform X2 n=1 Tax=Ptychodera flava TaxID=63121 RepID=UPI00396A3405